MQDIEGRTVLWPFLEFWLSSRGGAIFPVPKVSSVKEVVGRQDTGQYGSPVHQSDLPFCISEVGRIVSCGSSQSSLSLCLNSCKSPRSTRANTPWAIMGWQQSSFWDTQPQFCYSLTLGCGVLASQAVIAFLPRRGLQTWEQIMENTE